MSLNYSGPERVGRERIRVSINFADIEDSPGRTKQSFAEETNINSIMRRWHKLGTVTHLAGSPPTFGDFEDSSSYQDALNSLISADQAFAALSAEIRARMGNDPGTLMDFLADPANEEESIQLGLRPKPDPESKIVPSPDPQGATASAEGGDPPTDP